MEEESLSLYLTGQKFQKILFARRLRKRMTEAEIKLWMHLRGRKQKYKYRRQVPLGLYVADFCCMKHRLIIEVDGGIHEELKETDAMRDELLKTGNFRLVRFKNQDVLKNIKKVLNELDQLCS